MFELFKLLEACAHIAHPIVINDSILFVYEDKKVTLKATMAENVYDVFEDDKFFESMTEKEILTKYKIQTAV
jgi:hypothetical protein